jgi:hypothetical protein
MVRAKVYRRNPQQKGGEEVDGGGWRGVDLSFPLFSSDAAAVTAAGLLPEEGGG